MREDDRSIIRAHVASEITIDVDQLDPPLLAGIKAALTFPNEEREKQLALRKFGAWDLPETVEMYRVEPRRGGDHVLCLPRGFAPQLVQGLQVAGKTVEWNDQRTSALATPGYFRPFALRDYQMQAAMQMMVAEQGVYCAPAGSGKTTTMLGLMAVAQQRTIVITDKAFLLEQWRERAAQFLGLSLDYEAERSVGKIGEDVWEERDLTICLRQTLFSRLWETKATEWFSRFGLAVLDESHHAGSADTLQEVVREIPTRMIFGVSATPARTEMQAKVVCSLLGPIVAETTRQELYDRGILVRPSLQIVETELVDTHWKVHDSEPDGTCQVPDCKKTNRHSHNDNYQSCLKRLVENSERNALIGQTIALQRGHVHLVASRQLKHLNLIKKAIEEAGWDGPIYLLRGEENALGDSQEIVKAIQAGGHWEVDKKILKEEKRRVWVQTKPPENGRHEAVILSSVADEGMDIPMIDRLHIAFPMRQEAATIQLIGRCERVANGKEDAVIYDYHDRGCSIFDDQHRDRRRTYGIQGIDRYVEPEREEKAA